MLEPAIAGAPDARRQLCELARTGILHADLAGYDLWLSRTGYTGEPVAFEIFVHPDQLVGLWHVLLAAGKPFGARPIGLAARDSLRIEAGLPLYGHELDGPLGLNPADAGFQAYVKLYQPYFIGKAAYVAHEKARSARVVRFRLDEEHAPVPGPGDVIVNQKGHVVGWVTSASLDSEGRLTGMGYVQDANNERGARLGVFRVAGRNWETRPLVDLKPGDRLQMPDDITVIERFLNKK
jgi:glycine hydroxymethyltransferase